MDLKYIYVSCCVTLGFRRQVDENSAQLDFCPGKKLSLLSAKYKDLG
jgi:hypothetical protein